MSALYLIVMGVTAWLLVGTFVAVLTGRLLGALDRRGGGADASGPGTGIVVVGRP